MLKLSLIKYSPLNCVWFTSEAYLSFANQLPDNRKVSGLNDSISPVAIPGKPPVKSTPVRVRVYEGN